MLFAHFEMTGLKVQEHNISGMPHFLTPPPPHPTQVSFYSIRCLEPRGPFLERPGSLRTGSQRGLWSACRFVEFDTSIICRVLVNYFGSFLLQDMFLNLQVFAFEGQNMTYTVNVLLTCILNCDAGPG